MVDEEYKTCDNCAHTHLPLMHTICLRCRDHSNWEPAEIRVELKVADPNEEGGWR